MIFDATIQRFLKKYAAHQGPVALFAILFSVFQSLLLLPSIYLIRNIFDTYLPQRDARGLIMATCAMLALAIAQTLTAIVHRDVFLKIVKKSIGDLQRDILDSLLNANHKFYDHTDRAKIINHTVADVDRADKLMDSLLSVLIPQTIIFSIGVVIIFFYNPVMGIAVLLLGSVGALVQRSMRKKVLDAISDYENAKDDLTAYVGFLPEKHVLTKMRNAEITEAGSAAFFSRSLIEKGTTAARRGNQITSSNDLIINISVIILIALGAYQLLVNDTSFGAVFGIYLLILFLRRSIGLMQTSWGAVHEGQVSLQRIFRFQDNIAADLIPPARTSSPFDGNIELRKVAFGYDHKKILNQIDFEISSKEIVCITGQNGSGKSSLINLLLGFYEPDAGDILISGRSYREVSVGTIRSFIGYVPQNQVLIDGTIWSNLNYGLTSESEPAVDSLQKTALFRHLMDGFSDGLNTVVAEGGRNLSNGQVQRISILRALASAPMLLILDEPTNHLDVSSVRELIREIKTELAIGVIVISHHAMFQEIATRTYLLTDGELKLISEDPV